MNLTELAQLCQDPGLRPMCLEEWRRGAEERIFRPAWDHRRSSSTFKFFKFSLIEIGAGSSFIRNDEGPGMRELGGSVDKHFGPR